MHVTEIHTRSATPVWCERRRDLDAVSVLKHLSDDLSHIQLRPPIALHVNLGVGRVRGASGRWCVGVRACGAREGERGGVCAGSAGRAGTVVRGARGAREGERGQGLTFSIVTGTPEKPNQSNDEKAAKLMREQSIEGWGVGGAR